MTLDWDGRKALRQARFTMLTSAFAAPVLYAGAISMQTLGGHWQGFFQNTSRIPWHEPRVPWVLGLALVALAGALVVPSRLQAGSSPLGILRLRNLASAMLLLVAAICGLYTGMKLGSGAAPLALAILAGPPAIGFLLFPTEARWNRAIGG